MVILSGVEIPHHPIAEFCRRHGVKPMSLFGSILRDDFGPDRDIDVLVEFAPECRRHGTKLAQRFNAGNPAATALPFPPPRTGRVSRPVRGGGRSEWDDAPAMNRWAILGHPSGV